MRAKLAKFEERAPGILYTWVDQKKLKSMIDQFQGEQAGFFSSVYFTRTPLSTFMYGPILVRIKLRPGPLKSRVAGGDRYFSLPGSSTELISNLRQVNLAPLELREYALQSFTPDLVESFSYSRPETLKEMNEERRLLSDPSRPYLDLAFRDTRTGTPLLFHPGSPTMDGHAWNQDELEKRFHQTQDQIDQQTGRVFYAPGVDPKASPHFAPNDLRKQLLTLQDAP